MAADIPVLVMVTQLSEYSSFHSVVSFIDYNDMGM